MVALVHVSVSGWLWLQGKVVRFFAVRIMRHHHHPHPMLRVPLMDAMLVGPAWGVKSCGLLHALV
jgi:hypothetical protein